MIVARLSSFGLRRRPGRTNFTMIPSTAIIVATMRFLAIAAIVVLATAILAVASVIIVSLSGPSPAIIFVVVGHR